VSDTASTHQNITIRLDRRVLRKVKVLAARRNTSISRLLAQQIETLVGEDDAYEQARRRALALLDRGLRLGGRIETTRDERVLVGRVGIEPTTT
jgi:predicted transcriptional regulator